MAEIQIQNPGTLGKPLGQYSQITRVRASEFLFIAGRVVGQCRAVQHLSGPLAGNTRLYEIQVARVPENVYEWRLSPEHAGNGRPIGGRSVSGRGPNHRGALGAASGLDGGCDLGRRVAPAPASASGQQGPDRPTG